MRRWLFLTLGLWLICAVVITAGVIVGRAQPPLDIIEAFGIDKCEGVPCVQGVIPGVTLWSEALTRTADRVPEVGQLNMGGSLGIYTRHFISIRVPAFQTNFYEGALGRVRDIVILNLYQRRLTADILIAQYGSPCKVRVQDFPPALELVYPYYSMHIPLNAVTGNRLMPDFPVQYILLARNSCSMETVNEKQYEMSWLGFTRLERYFNDGK